MKLSERPPLKHKKGIQVVQPVHPSLRPHPESKDSGFGSMYSSNRSRGISISRQTGITMDKIYDAKHFIPPKSNPQQVSTAQKSQNRTISSVRSLKLISMFADSNVDSACPADNSQKKIEQLPPVSEFELQKHKITSFQNRCNSPILKLAHTQDPIQSMNMKGEPRTRPNILKF